MDARIACQTSTKKLVDEFVEGFGDTYDAALRFVFVQMRRNGETLKQAGYRLRAEVDPSLVDTPPGDGDKEREG